MQNASDEVDDSSGNTGTISTDDSSSSCSGESWHRDSDCICGSDNSNSDWIDINCVESKRAKFEVDKNLSPHQQLHRAIRLHDCKMIRQLLEDGVQPCNIKDSSNCFVLAYKSKFILKKLLEIEPSGVNCQDSGGYTMLMLSVNTNEKVFKFLCKYRPDVNLLNDDGDNILHYVLKRYLYFDASIIKSILDLGVDVNVADRTGETALTLAVKAGSNANIVGMLLDREATLPPPDENGKTILMHAIGTENVCFRDKVELIKLLIKHGVDASAKDKNGHNAMYYIISECLPTALFLKYGINCLNEIIIVLLEHNCEVQGFDRTFERSELIYTCDSLIGTTCTITVGYDVISKIVRDNENIEILKELLKRDLYSRKITNPNVLSPLSACLMDSLTHVRLEIGRRIIRLAKELILLGMDVSQRIWHELICPGYTEPLEYNHRTRGEYQAAVAKELEIPDALLFVANMRLFYYDLMTLGFPITSEDYEIRGINIELEELLRSLLRFWPHPPLLLMLLRVDPVWCPSLLTTIFIDSSSGTGMHFMMKVLAKIGGPLPLGTRYYTILKSALQKMAERHPDVYKPMLNIMLSQTNCGIPSLRSLSSAAFRATVKKTCLTGLDFSEYRVLCQGEMVPLPYKLVKLLEFRD